MTKIITPKLIDHLYQENSITQEVRRAGLAHLDGPRPWGLWIERLFLSLGASLLLAAVLFFFAYNWQDLSKWFKFMLVEAALLSCLFGALLPLKSEAIGQTLGVAASFLLGVLLALIGQTYQTGANAWTLFALWSALILPWVLLSRFSPQWALWLAVTNIALYFFIEQTLNLGRGDAALLPLAHALLNGVFFILFLGTRSSLSWLQNPWTLRLFHLALVANLCLLTITLIFESRTEPLLGLIIATLSIPAHAGLFYLSRHKWRDFITHACLIIAAAIEGEALIIKFITENSRWSADGIFLATILTLLMFTALVTYLYKAHQTLELVDEQ